MPGLRCVLLRGVRLSGNKVCLFDGPPQDPECSSYHHGVFDICHKKKFSPPRDCKPLLPSGPIIDEIPFIVDGIFNLYKYQSDPLQLFPSRAEALANMWARGGILQSSPWPGHFEFRFLWNLYLAAPDGWTADGGYSSQVMVFKSEWLDPTWLTDDDVVFSLVFTAPAIAGAPEWTYLDFLSVPVLFNSGPHEVSVSKGLFVVGDVKFPICCSPDDFSEEQFDSLPFWGDTQTKGWLYLDITAFGLKLRVRRGAKDFKVCWPEDIFKKPAYAAVVDSVSGFVVGPPLKIY